MIAEGIWSICGMITDIRTPKYMEKNLLQCHIVHHHKSHIGCPHIKLDFYSEKPEAYLTYSLRSIYLYICRNFFTTTIFKNELFLKNYG
jgi:hypothetical protein